MSRGTFELGVNETHGPVVGHYMQNSSFSVTAASKADDVALAESSYSRFSLSSRVPLASAVMQERSRFCSGGIHRERDAEFAI